MFFRRRDRKPEPEGSPGEDQVGVLPSQAPPGTLEPIRIYTRDDSVVDGWAALGSQRLSDLLNGEDMLSVSRVPEDPGDDDWLAVEREEMVIVAAPPHTSPRQLRVHRQKREMTAQGEHFSIRGTVHLIPGNRLDRTVLRTRQHFLPITEAVMESAAEPGTVIHHDALLLNIANLGEDVVLSVLED